MSSVPPTFQGFENIPSGFEGPKPKKHMSKKEEEKLLKSPFAKLLGSKKEDKEKKAEQIKMLMDSLIIDAMRKIKHESDRMIQALKKLKNEEQD